MYDHLTDMTQAETDLKAENARLKKELDIAERSLRNNGYRKQCDIAACNCGPQWHHGGHANDRLREIADALPYHNGGTLLSRIIEIVNDRERLQQALDKSKEKA